MDPLVVGLLSLVMILGLVRSGAAYIYCASMGEIVSDCCCDVHHHARDDGRPQIEVDARCCTIEAMRSVPGAAATPARAAVPEAQALPGRFAVAHASLRVSARPAIQMPPQAPNTGPPKPSDIPRRLRVFLI